MEDKGCEDGKENIKKGSNKNGKEDGTKKDNMPKLLVSLTHSNSTTMLSYF